mmetsp:Transcript_7413/g.16322  ORF Transcript_7413/g.16322 Transcript_7413/m.16322 type:complete len:272 (-) Transcript_7413:201-1016(-)
MRLPFLQRHCVWLPALNFPVISIRQKATEKFSRCSPVPAVLDHKAAENAWKSGPFSTYATTWKAGPFSTHATTGRCFATKAKQREGIDALGLKELRLVGNDGTQQILGPEEALEIASKKNLRLVEVGPMATPPTWKLMEQPKEPPKKKRDSPSPKADSLSRAAQNIQRRAQMGKPPRQKDVRVMDKCHENDLRIKLQQAKQFLSKGIVVKITVLASKRTDVDDPRARANATIQRFIDETQETSASSGIQGEGFAAITVLTPRISKPGEPDS